MTVKLIKTTSNPCVKCGSQDFRLTFLGAMYCVGCQTYVYKEFRDIKKAQRK